MKKTKSFIFFLLILLLTFCTKKQELDGFWHGELKFGNERNPVLIKFNNDSIIDFFNPFIDTIIYKRSGNKINFQNKLNEEQELKISINENELSIWKLKSESLFITLKKRNSKNFIYDYLNDKSMILNLPNGKGIIRTLGNNFYLDRPLYLINKENLLIANFMDTSVSVNSEYHKFLRSKGTYLSDFESSLEKNWISLIGDKNLKVSDINLLTKQLRLAGFSKVYYFLKSESYEKVNILPSTFRALTELDYKEYNSKIHHLRPPPPSIINHLPNFNGELLIAKVERNRIIVNDKIFNIKSFNDFIKSKILADNKVAIIYYISDNSSYQDFIDFNGTVYNIYYDLRDEYLEKKYKINFRDNFDSTIEEIIEVKKKYPLFFLQIDSLEYKKIKYNL